MCWADGHVFFDSSWRKRLEGKRWLKLCRTLILMQGNFVKKQIRNMFPEPNSRCVSVSHQQRLEGSMKLTIDFAHLGVFFLELL